MDGWLERRGGGRVQVAETGDAEKGLCGMVVNPLKSIFRRDVLYAESVGTSMQFPEVCEAMVRVVSF